MEKELSLAKKVAFAAASLSIFIGLVFALTELGLRLKRSPGTGFDSRESLDRKLRESEAADVSVVTTGNLKGLVRPSESRELVYELKPNGRWIFQGAETTTNSHGLRGKELALDKPEDTCRIVGIGDSVMFGWGVGQNEMFTAVLERHLEGKVEAKRVEVLNFAVPGYNTMQEAIVFREKCLPFSPDLLLVAYSLNDWAAPFFVRDPQRDGIIETSLVLQMVRDRVLAQIDDGYIDAYRGSDKASKALEAIARLAAERAIPVIFFVYPHEPAWEAFAYFAGVAEELGFHYVDLPAEFELYYAEHSLPGNEALRLSSSDYHPNPEGHRLIAEILEPTVVSLLEAARLAR